MHCLHGYHCVLCVQSSICMWCMIRGGKGGGGGGGGGEREG